MSVRASHILIKHVDSRNPVSRRTNGSVDTSLVDAMTELQALHAHLLSNPSEFSAVAKKRSDCSSYKQGGDLGVFERGQMQEGFEVAAFGLKVGAMSGVVSSDSGYHLILRTA